MYKKVYFLAFFEIDPLASGCRSHLRQNVRGTAARSGLATRRRLVDLLRRGREYPGVTQLPEITEEALVGAISAILSRVVVDGDLDDAEELSSQLVAFALVFY